MELSASKMIDDAFIIWDVSIDCLSRRVRLVAGVYDS
jgi:hypothetical protein